MPSPFDQSTYQVRLDWGTAGLARLAPADIVVVVDVLRFSSTVTDAIAAGNEIDLADAVEWSTNGAAVATAAGAEATVLVGGIRNASAVARAVQTVQEQPAGADVGRRHRGGGVGRGRATAVRGRGPPRCGSDHRRAHGSRHRPHRTGRGGRRRGIPRPTSRTASSAERERLRPRARGRRPVDGADGGIRRGADDTGRCGRARRGRRRAGAARRTVHAFRVSSRTSVGRSSRRSEELPRRILRPAGDLRPGPRGAPGLGARHVGSWHEVPPRSHRRRPLRADLRRHRSRVASGGSGRIPADRVAVPGRVGDRAPRGRPAAGQAPCGRGR